MTIYVVMYVLTPYLVNVLKSISKKQYDYLIVIMLIVFVIWPTIARVMSISPILAEIGISPLDNSGGYSLYHFFTLYILGSYIKLYYDNLMRSKILLISIYIVCMSLVASINIGLSYKLQQFVAILEYNSILIVIGSVSVFLMFKNARFSNKLINRLAELTLGIYLIHEHIYVRNWVYAQFNYGSVFNAGTMKFLMYTIMMASTIYICCMGIEYMRIVIFKMIMSIINKFFTMRNIGQSE